MIEVNLLGVYYTLRAAAPHIAHKQGYILAIASLGAVMHPPLLGAYAAAAAGVEALGDVLRVELSSSGARVEVAYFGELETDMTSRKFDTHAMSQRYRGLPPKLTPLPVAVDAIEQGIVNRSRRAVPPRSVALVLHTRMLAQRMHERRERRGLDDALETARGERAAHNRTSPRVPNGPSARFGELVASMLVLSS